MIDDILRTQCGALTRAQALAGGVTRGAIRHHLAAGRWQRVFAGVYATFSGPVPRQTTLWAALLAAGPGAMLSHWSAAEVAGLADAHRAPAQVVHVTVPATRKVRRVPGVIVHRSRDARRLRHPTVLPPQTRVEETVLDLSQLVAGLEDAYAVMARAVNAGLSTPERLLAAMAKRPRMRWRRLLREGLGDVAAGCRSVLELSYLRKVERGHGLPTGDRQVRVTRGRRRNYLDVRYRQYRTSVELDGEAAHPRHERFRDMRRDNARVAEGDAPLRYGMADVEQRPCEVAMQVAQVLRRAGWRGTPRRCPRCPTSPW